MSDLLLEFIAGVFAMIALVMLALLILGLYSLIVNTL